MLPFLTRLSSSFGRHLPSFASFFFSPHAGGAQLWPHSVSSPIWCFLAMCPRGAAAAVGHPSSPSCGAGPGTPPQESLRGAPTPCACPWGWDQGPQRGLATCGGPALPAASSRREAAKHRLWQRAAGRGTREGSEQSSSPAGFHFCQGLQRCFVPLCWGVGWQDPRTRSRLAPQDPSCPVCFMSPNQWQWGSTGSPSWKGDIQRG